MDEPAVFYSPRAWVGDRDAYVPDDWRYAKRWPPREARPRRLDLRGDGSLGADRARNVADEEQVALLGFLRSRSINVSGTSLHDDLEGVKAGVGLLIDNLHTGRDGA